MEHDPEEALKTARTIPQALAAAVLSVLEIVAGAWRRAFFVLLVVPLNDRSRPISRDACWAMIHHLYRSEAAIARAIYRTARRLAGLPRVSLPLDLFYLPKLKTPAHLNARWIQHTHRLEHVRRHAIRLALAWASEAGRLARDPLARLRGSPAARLAVLLASPLFPQNPVRRTRACIRAPPGVSITPKPASIPPSAHAAGTAHVREFPYAPRFCALAGPSMRERLMNSIHSCPSTSMPS